MFKIGDKVRIKHLKSNYTIISVLAEKLYAISLDNLDTLNRLYFTFPESELELIKTDIPKPIPTYNIFDACSHKNKVKSYALGKSFWYCRDCREEVYE